MRTLKRWMVVVFLMIFPISVLACSNAGNVSSNTSQRYDTPYQYSMDEKDKFLILYPEMTKEEVEKEDNFLMKKYSQYSLDVALRPANIYNTNKLDDTDRALIFLDGGPTFFKSRDHLDEIVNDKYPGFKVDLDENNYLVSQGFDSAYFGFLGDTDDVATSLVNDNLLLMQKKLKTNVPNPYLYGFINSQMVLANDVFNKIYSYQEMTEIQLMNSIILHQAITNLKKQGKKVFIWGSSYGAMTLYNYITRYGNDTNGMLATGGPIKSRHGIYHYFKGRNTESLYADTEGSIPSIDYLKYNFRKENFPNKAAKISTDKRKKKRVAKEEVLSYNLEHNRMILINVTSNLTNSLTISKKLLDDKTIITFGTRDKRFDVLDFSIRGFPKKEFLMKLQTWIWGNLKKSGAHIIEMAGAVHTARFPSAHAALYIAANMILERPPLDIETDNEMQKILTWLND